MLASEMADPVFPPVDPLVGARVAQPMHARVETLPRQGGAVLLEAAGARHKAVALLVEACTYEHGCGHPQEPSGDLDLGVPHKTVGQVCLTGSRGWAGEGQCG